MSEASECANPRCERTTFLLAPRQHIPAGFYCSYACRELDERLATFGDSGAGEGRDA